MAKLTNNELIERYKRDMELDTDMLAESTISGHIRYVTMFLESMQKPAFDISKNEINKYVLGLKKQNGEDMNIDAKQNHMSSIKRFYNFLFLHSDDRDIMQMRYFYDDHDHKIEIPNPADGLKSVNSSAAAKLLKNPRKEGMTAEEAQRLLKVLKGNMEYADKFLCEEKRFIAHRNYTMIMMMLEIGLRYSDISSLERSKTVINTATKQMNIVIKKTKKPMTFALSEHLIKELNDYVKLHKDRQKIFVKGVAVRREKSSRHNADALGFLEQLGNVIRREQLGIVVGEDLYVIQLIDLRDLGFHAIELVLLDQTRKAHLQLQGTVFLISPHNGILSGRKYGMRHGIGGIAIQNFKYGFHDLFLSPFGVWGVSSHDFFVRGGVSRSHVFSCPCGRLSFLLAFQ